MKILLISAPTENKPVARDMAGGLGFDGASGVALPPLDLAYIAATLINKGNEVRIIDGNIGKNKKEEILKAIRTDSPQVIITTVSLPSIYSDCIFAKDIRMTVGAKIIVKTNISYEPVLKEIVRKSQTDLCVYGECDLIIDRIISGQEKRGTAYFKDGEFIVEEKLEITNLDDLPLPARNLLDNGAYRYILLPGVTTSMQTSRGCPYPCSYYCPYPLTQGKIWRARSPEHVISEIKDISTRYGIFNILFRDATFTYDKDRTEKICELIIGGGVNIRWWCETRVDRLNYDIMRKMKQAGCRGMNIGVETGDSELMVSKAKIGMTIDKLRNVRKAAQELGLRLHFLLMIGLPGETKRSLYETYKMVGDLKPETLGVCIVTPYPGTPLYAEAKKKGWIETLDWTKYGGHLSVMHTDELSSKDTIIAATMMLERAKRKERFSIKGRLLEKMTDIRFKRWSGMRG